MPPRLMLIVGAGVLVVGAFIGTALWNGRVSTNPESLLKRLPTQDAAVVGVDFAALRRFGFMDWLNRDKAPEDADYVAFIRETGFDYQRDLDSVLVSFAPDGEFFLIKGTFNWPKLEEYVLRQHGSCYDDLCRVTGSTADRHISFFPLKHNLMAMAVASDDTAATRLKKAGPQSDVDVPSAPVWMTLSAGALRGSRNLPGGTQMFASAVKDASRVTLTGAAANNAFEIRLDAICQNAQQAGALTMQLQMLTKMLADGARQTGKIDDAGLTGLLTAGTFQQSGAHVFGHWPVQPELLRSISAPY